MTDREYKPVSTLAVVAAVLAAAGAMAFVFVPFLAATGVSLLVAVAAWRGIARHELAGRSVLAVGIVAATLTITLAPAWHAYRHHLELVEYRAEALPGHRRLDFSKLMHDEEHRLDRFDQERVCLKGYVLSASSRQLVLAPSTSSGFGAYKDDGRAITVEIPDGRAITLDIPDISEWVYHPVAVSGRLVVDRDSDKSTARYRLVASLLTKSRTGRDLRPRGGGC
jgi:RNase P/RNase MRP subunit p29